MLGLCYVCIRLGSGLADNSFTLFITIKKVSMKIHPICPQKFTQNMSMKLHPKSAILVNLQNSPILSTKRLPPFKTPQSNELYLVMVVQLQLLSNHVLCMSKETLLTDGWPDRNSLAYFFFYYSFMMS